MKIQDTVAGSRKPKSGCFQEDRGMERLDRVLRAVLSEGIDSVSKFKLCLDAQLFSLPSVIVPDPDSR